MAITTARRWRSGPVALALVLAVVAALVGGSSRAGAAPGPAVVAVGAATAPGDLAGHELVAAVVGMAATPSGDGYWLVAADGGIFAFGDAGFFGSTGGLALNAPVVGLAPTATGLGYRLVTADGGVFAFGDADFQGSLGAAPPPDPVVALAPTADGGYAVLTTAGDVGGFGGAPGGHVATIGAPAVALLALADGLVVVGADGALQAVGPTAVPGPAPDLTGQRVVAASTTPAGGIRLATVPATTDVVAGGDVHGEGRVGALLDRGGDPLGAVADVVGRADLALVNLETAVGTGGAPEPKEFTFRADAALLRSLARTGVDVVSLANNHSLDYGVDVLPETLAEVGAAGLAAVGAGPDAAAAYAARVVATPAGPVAVVGLSQVVPPGWAAGPTRPGVATAWDRAAAVAAVRHAAEVADAVVVVVHWGEELDRCPTTTQRSLAHALVDAGADVVIGAHPHVLQGIDVIDGAVVAYSLGNLAWYTSGPETGATALVRVTLGGGHVVGYDVVPAVIDGAGRPVPATGAAAADIVGATEALRPGGDVCPG
jgi:poly-gamma-glutamate synthesis protein (capsule biosynthesis protein)